MNQLPSFQQLQSNSQLLQQPQLHQSPKISSPLPVTNKNSNGPVLKMTLLTPRNFNLSSIVNPSQEKNPTQSEFPISIGNSMTPSSDSNV